jgi:hypothetical protein
MPTKKKYIAYRPQGTGSCWATDRTEDFMEIFLDTAEVGEKYEIKVVEYTDEELANLPEFEGF